MRDGYTDEPPLSFRFACGWMKYAPRARGWLPRRIGRGIGRGTRFTIRTRSGARLAVDPANLDFYCRVQLQHGVWEAEVVDACLALIRPGDVFYDVGACAGIVTVDVARTFGGSVAVHAFEPQPTLARALSASIALNGFAHVRLHQMLLADARGDADLYLVDHGIHASLVARHPRASRLRCRVESIDALVAAGLPPPTVLKIDVEGAELRVLEGARRTFSAAPPALVFEADENMKRFGYTLRDLCDRLCEFGDYVFYRIDGSSWVPADAAGQAVGADYVAVPRAWGDARRTAR